jgi:hypothetical protein
MPSCSAVQSTLLTCKVIGVVFDVTVEDVIKRTAREGIRRDM